MEPTMARQKFDKLVEDIRPLAKELIAEAMKTKHLYQDGYPTVMNMLQEIEQKEGKTAAFLFGYALILEGYPKPTMQKIAKLINWV